MTGYAELGVTSNFSFLSGASHPEEYIQQAQALGYSALALCDECSLAGVVRAYAALKENPAPSLKLIIGARFSLHGAQAEALNIVLLAPDREAYAELSTLITLGRRQAEKGHYQLTPQDVIQGIQRCLCLLTPADISLAFIDSAHLIAAHFAERCWLGLSLLQEDDDYSRFQHFYAAAKTLDLRLTAYGNVCFHIPERKPLHDVLTAIRLNTRLSELGTQTLKNAERHLRPLSTLARIYPAALLQETLRIAERCSFSLGKLRYEYPSEIIPAGQTPSTHLRELAWAGATRRWPQGVPPAVQAQIQRELAFIAEREYEHFFLTVHDMVCFAREQNILCQGRGSAANSAVCFCLGITEVDPAQHQLLFERFLSSERHEPPDIDVDFEHERREEVIQYIYGKYGRDRAALAATVICYRTRSALRDVGRALGLDEALLDHLAKSLAWWDKPSDLVQRLSEAGIGNASGLAQQLLRHIQTLRGFPRHLSQHVGGFVISSRPVPELVPVENAAMAGRTVIQWDKDDLETLGLLKVDVLALGMLTAIRKTLDLLAAPGATRMNMADIPAADSATYDMLCQADSVGLFQVESRAQMAMLPQLKPRAFYDLVVQVAIVRPGPIQGDMVRPYLARRQGREPIVYPSAAVKSVLERTYGVPIFQEQVIKMTMVAAGFSGGEADRLRRAMASWKKYGELDQFERRFKTGMAQNGYETAYADRLWQQMLGFGEYGFPESHAISFALLVYVSAWLKRHHPAAFCCGLLNSLPMGFYSPSQLIQDAQRHGIGVQPIRVESSHWDHSLENTGQTQPAIRLGLRLVQGFNPAAAQRLMQARTRQPFQNLQDLKNRAQLNQAELSALIAADALATLAGHRSQSQWQAAGLQTPAPLLSALESNLDDAVYRPAPSLQADLLQDYQSTGLSLKSHPMQLLRAQNPFTRCLRAAQLRFEPHGRFVRVAGVVTGRQRPGTAGGIIFMTLEDETGNINVVIKPELQERCRRALLSSRIALVKGILEKRGEVMHVLAGTLEDVSTALAELQPASRDFH